MNIGSMTDENIAKRLAEAAFLADELEGLFLAIRLFVERVAIPPSVGDYGTEMMASYIRDALKRGMDHWEVCSPADTEVSSFADNEEVQ
jgi:hypothetical protein